MGTVCAKLLRMSITTCGQERADAPDRVWRRASGLGTRNDLLVAARSPTRFYTAAILLAPPKKLRTVVATRSYLHPTGWIESDPWISCPPKVLPVREAELSPQLMPVS